MIYITTKLWSLTFHKTSKLIYACGETFSRFTATWRRLTRKHGLLRNVNALDLKKKKCKGKLSEQGLENCRDPLTALISVKHLRYEHVVSLTRSRAREPRATTRMFLHQNGRDHHIVKYQENNLHSLK